MYKTFPDRWKPAEIHKELAPRQHEHRLMESSLTPMATFQAFHGVLCLAPMVRDIVENRDSTARDHLANERTFLAWVRTALGLVGLGVLLERLGAGGEIVAVAAGVGFISFGGLSLIYAVSRYLWVAKHLEKGMFPVAIRGPIVIAFGALSVTAGAMLYVLLLH
jgi:putative membrane protein